MLNSSSVEESREKRQHVQLDEKGPSNNATSIETVTDKLLPFPCFLPSSGPFDCARQAGKNRTYARRKRLAGFTAKV